MCLTRKKQTLLARARKRRRVARYKRLRARLRVEAQDVAPCPPLPHSVETTWKQYQQKKRTARGAKSDSAQNSV